MKKAVTPRTLIIALIVLTVVLLNFGAYVLYTKNEQIRSAGDWVQHTLVAMTQTQDIFTSVQDMMTGQRGYLLSGRKDFLDPYNAADQHLDSKLNALAQFTSDNPVQVKNTAKLKLLVAEQREITRKQIEKYNGAKLSPDVFSMDDILRSKVNMDKIRALKTRILEEEERLLKLRSENEARFQRNFTTSILLICAISAALLVAGTILVFIISAKRRIAEEGLHSSEERFALAIKGMQDGVFDHWVDEKRIYFSPRLKEMLGETDASMPDEPSEVERRLHPDDREKMLAIFNAYRRQELDSYVNIYRLRHRAGGYRWIMSRGAGIWNEDGVLLRIVGAFTDITEQREREDSLKRMNHELESFTYIASHDLRSPLVNLKGFAGEMQMGIDGIAGLLDRIEAGLPEADREAFRRVLREDIPDALRFIQSSVVKMDRLTNGILELSRIGRRELRSEQISVERVVTMVVNSLSHQIQERGIEVIVGTLPDLTSDTLAVEQIFGNVLDNAIKYLDPKRKGRIEISGETMGEINLYQVRDNGRGIDPADMQKIFEIFRRAGNNDQIEGEGMGMSYVKATLRRLGGTIWCESTKGEGTAFFFTILNQAAQRSAA